MTAWDWIKTKLWPFVKKFWKPILVVVAIIVAVILGKHVIGKVIDSIFGKVKNGQPFGIIPGDPAHVTISTPQGPKIVKLPCDAAGKQVTSDRVTALAYQEGYVATVEVTNNVVNRR
jgi:hypothetical protein